MKGSHEHDEQPTGTEEVTSTGVDSFAIIGTGATGGVLVESLRNVGFDNVFLVGLDDIRPIGIPEERKLYLKGTAPTMQDAEALLVPYQMTVFETMDKILGRPSRIFMVVGLNEPFSAGTTLVMLECAHHLLRSAGLESGQRVGIFAMCPPAGEVLSGPAARDVSWLVGKLVELNSQRLFDPLVVGDRSNLCALFDSLSAPVEGTETSDQVDGHPAEIVPPNRFGSSFYEE